MKRFKNMHFIKSTIGYEFTSSSQFNKAPVFSMLLAMSYLLPLSFFYRYTSKTHILSRQCYISCNEREQFKFRLGDSHQHCCRRDWTWQISPSPARRACRCPVHGCPVGHQLHNHLKNSHYPVYYPYLYFNYFIAHYSKR